MTSVFRQGLDVLFRGIDEAEVFPVPASGVDAWEAAGNAPSTVRGLFDSRDVVMTDGAVDVDTVEPVFHCTLADLNAAAASERNAAVRFSGVLYDAVRIIPRDPGFAELRLRRVP